MRSAASDFELITARSQAEALSLLAAGELRLFAGGTDLMVLFEAGKLAHHKWLSIWGIAELRQIKIDPQHIDLGCLVTYSQIRSHPTLAAEFPNLGQAAAETGALAIQNRGTLGGNIANASPAADSPPALLSYGASVKLSSAQGERWLPYSEFHLGYKQTALLAGEMLTAVRLPRSHPKHYHYYRKVGTRAAQAISKVVAAAVVGVEPATKTVNEFQLAFGSVGPTTQPCPRVAKQLLGQRLSDAVIEAAVRELQHELAPIDDLRSTRLYRLSVAGNLLRECLKGARDG